MRKPEKLVPNVEYTLRNGKKLILNDDIVYGNDSTDARDCQVTFWIAGPGHLYYYGDGPKIGRLYHSGRGVNGEDSDRDILFTEDSFVPEQMSLFD